MERTWGPFVQVCRSVRVCVGNGSVSGVSADLVPVEAHVEPVWCIEFPACQGHLGTFRNSKALATPRRIKTVSGWDMASEVFILLEGPQWEDEFKKPIVSLQLMLGI